MTIFMQQPQKAAQKDGIDCKMVLHPTAKIYEIDPLLHLSVSFYQ